MRRLRSDVASPTHGALVYAPAAIASARAGVPCLALLALLLASGCGRLAPSGSGGDGDSEDDTGAPEGSADGSGGSETDGPVDAEAGVEGPCVVTTCDGKKISIPRPTPSMSISVWVGDEVGRAGPPGYGPCTGGGDASCYCQCEYGTGILSPFPLCGACQCGDSGTIVNVQGQLQVCK
jgi:hypothetical protein